jgi:hypothetical protein
MPQTGRGKRLLARTSRRSSLPAGEDARLQTTYRLPLTMDGSPSRHQLLTQRVARHARFSLTASQP